MQQELLKLRSVIRLLDLQKERVMPILMWIAFWSTMTGVANGWRETMLPIRVKVKDRRDQSGK